MAQKVLIIQICPQLKIKHSKLIENSQHYVFVILDQSEIVESKLLISFEWWAIFGPLYFETYLELFLHIPLLFPRHHAAS